MPSRVASVVGGAVGGAAVRGQAGVAAGMAAGMGARRGVRRGLTRLGRIGGRPQRALEGTGVSGRFGKNMKLNDYYRRRGKIYATTIGTSAGVMGLRSRSSGGSGELPSQNMPMY